MRALKFAVAALCITAVGACSGDDFNLFSEETLSGEAQRQPLPKTSVVRIDNLELGRLFRGYMLIAEGVAPGTGYYAPELRIRYGGELGPDGFYEFDFVAAAPPDPRQGANAPLTARLLRGDYELTPQMLRAARGVRVYSERDSVEGRF